LASKSPKSRAWGTLLAVVTVPTAVLACSSILGLRDDYRLAADGGGVDVDAATGDANEGVEDRPITGSITVHLGYGPPGAVTAQYVILGDGSKIPPKAVTGDTVTFQDPSLSGAADVTWAVQSNTGGQATITVTTLLGVAKNDVWFGTARPTSFQGTLSGRFSASSLDAGNTVLKVASSASAFALSDVKVEPDGSFTARLLGPSAGTTQLVAWQEFTQPGYALLRPMGVSGPITLSGGGGTDVGTVALSRAFENTMKVRVTGAEAYPTQKFMLLSEFFPEPPPAPRVIRAYEAISVEAGAGSTTMATLPKGPDLDTWSRYVELSAYNEAGTGPFAWVRGIHQNAPLSLALPAPVAKVDRYRREGGPAATIGRSELALEYSVPPTAHLVALVFSGHSPDPLARIFRWTVIAAGRPDGKGTFVPFALPAEAVPVMLPAGDYEIALEALTSYDSVAGADLLGRRPGATSMREILGQARVRAEICARSEALSLR